MQMSVFFSWSYCHLMSKLTEILVENTTRRSSMVTLIQGRIDDVSLDIRITMLSSFSNCNYGQMLSRPWSKTTLYRFVHLIRRHIPRHLSALPFPQFTVDTVKCFCCSRNAGWYSRQTSCFSVPWNIQTKSATDRDGHWNWTPLKPRDLMAF